MFARFPKRQEIACRKIEEGIAPLADLRRCFLFDSCPGAMGETRRIDDGAMTRPTRPGRDSSCLHLGQAERQEKKGERQNGGWGVVRREQPSLSTLR